MATGDEHQQSKESVFLLDDAAGTPLLHRPETPALTAETILERSRGRCEPVRLRILDNVRRAANAAAGRLSATGRAIHDTDLGLRVRAAARVASRLPAEYLPFRRELQATRPQTARLTVGAATLLVLVVAVVLAPRPRRSSLESQSARAAALPAPATIPAPILDPTNVGTAGKRSDAAPAVDPRPGGMDRPVAATPGKAPAVPASDSPRSTVSPGLVGTLLVDSKPSGAEVSINGVSYGRTPLMVSALPAGSRVIRVELPGYERWTWAVNIAANKRTPLRVKLQPERRRVIPGS
jgi:PEGA domain